MTKLSSRSSSTLSSNQHSTEGRNVGNKKAVANAEGKSVKHTNEAPAGRTRFGIWMDKEDRERMQHEANLHAKGNATQWIKDRMVAALHPIKVLGLACCGPGLEAIEYLEDVRSFSDVRTLFPRTSATQYMLEAEGDSMRNLDNPRHDIQSGDLLLFRAQETAESGQIVHYEMQSDSGAHVCGIRILVRPSLNTPPVLRATNPMRMPDSRPYYADIVIDDDRPFYIRGVWTGIVVRGVRL